MSYELPKDLTAVEEEFYLLVKKHDLTYNFSDDHRVWRTGQKEYEIIRSFAKLHPEIRAREIWESVAYTKVREPNDQQFQRMWRWVP